VLFLDERGHVLSRCKIAEGMGGFTGTLHDLDYFGRALACVGDLDGNGVPDMAVGAYRDDDGGPNHGAVWILFMESDGTVSGQTKISETSGGFGGQLSQDGYFGVAVAALGDLNGDGHCELAVSEQLADDGGNSAGAVWILFLQADGSVLTERKISATAGGLGAALDAFDSFGSGVAGLGDLDGDGVPDLAVGAAGDGDGGAGKGALWILFLNADGSVAGSQKISDTHGDFAGALTPNDNFGQAVHCPGDVDGDGRTDVVVGTWRDDDGGPERGAIWVLALEPDGRVHRWRKISDLFGGFTGRLEDRDGFGISVGDVGDLDGDGIVELSVGAFLDDDGGVDRGAVWLVSALPRRETSTGAGPRGTRPARPEAVDPELALTFGKDGDRWCRTIGGAPSALFLEVEGRPPRLLSVSRTGTHPLGFDPARPPLTGRLFATGLADDGARRGPAVLLAASPDRPPATER